MKVNKIFSIFKNKTKKEVVRNVRACIKRPMTKAYKVMK